jgi:hypothetical protein
VVGGAAAVYFLPRAPQSTPSPSLAGVTIQPTPFPTVAPSAPPAVVPPLSHGAPQPPVSRPNPVPTIAPPPTTLAAVLPPTTLPRPTPRPTQLPPPTPRPTALPPSPPPPPTVTQQPGQLLLYVRPWANVSVDGRAVGTTPMKPLTLAAGTHVVLLKHNDFAPLTRQVVIEPGRTHRLEIDLSRDGQRLQ